MKKALKLIMMLSLIAMMCLIFASCNEVPVCEDNKHQDADGNLICDKCGSEIEVVGPSQAELDMATKKIIAKEVNEYLSSGVALINGERVLPNMSAVVEVKTNLLSSHWISRLKNFNIKDGKMHMVLENDNIVATAKNKNVYIGIAPTGMYAIEDDTISLDYTTHVYTQEQMRVVTPELTKDDFVSNGDGTFAFKHASLVNIFSRVLLTETALNINNGLYDRQLIMRLTDIMKSNSTIVLNSDNKIQECKIHLYTEDNGLKTDICTIDILETPAKQSVKISLNLNYIMDIEYVNSATETYQLFNQMFMFHTEKPGDSSFHGTDIQLSSRVYKSTERLVTFPQDIQDKMISVEKSLVYSKQIQEKYSYSYVITQATSCDSVYVYDERYDAYIQFKKTSGRQVEYAGVEFDYDTAQNCLGSINLLSKTISIIQHSDEELLIEELAAKYNGQFTSSTTECLNVAVYDKDYKKYILFKRTSDGNGGMCYTFAGIASSIDKSSTCQAEVILQRFVLVFTEHNTNHTSH